MQSSSRRRCVQASLGVLLAAFGVLSAAVARAAILRPAPAAALSVTAPPDALAPATSDSAPPTQEGVSLKP